MRQLSIAAVAVTALLTVGLLSSCHDKHTNPTVALELNGSLTALGGAYAHTFNTAGSFHYHCTIHPSCTSLQGTVTVVSAATPIVPADHVTAIQFTGGSVSSCSALTNQADSVQVGEVVTWTNNSPLPHTVTSF